MLDMIDRIRDAANEAVQCRIVADDATAAIDALDEALVGLLQEMTGIEDDGAIREALADYYGEG